MLIIKSVDEGSVGFEIGLEPNDKLLKFNGQEIEDVLDYFFIESQEEFTMTVDRAGEIHELEVEKYEDEDMGLNFVSDLDTRTCHNKCVFCFVDQMPEGYRDTLYCKDDDYRLSFISGNYVTLTNDTQKDLERIVRLQLTPIYVSVHATDGEVRKNMLANRFSDKIMSQLKYLTDNGITVHTQVVLCKNLNDGPQLQKTMEDLYSMYPMVKSLAIVPVGMTKFRAGLAHIEKSDKNFAETTIDLVDEFAKKCTDEVADAFVCCSDEFYCLTDREFPNKEHYCGYPQIENGVGLVRKFIDEFEDAVQENKVFNKKKTLLVTGVSFYPHLTKLLESVSAPHKVVCVENTLFGDTVTVAGLLTGNVIYDKIKDMDFERILLPQNVLREFGDVFLDNMTLEEFKEKVNAEVVISLNHGGKLYELL